MDFLKTLKLRNYSDHTIKTYENALKKFKRINNTSRISKDALRRFIEGCIKEGLNPRTINTYVIILRKFHKEKTGEDIDISDLKLKEPKTLPVTLSDEDFQEILLRVNDDQIIMAMKFAYYAGLRLSEVLNLDWRDFEFNDLVKIRIRGKGKKTRIAIIVNREFSDYLRKIRKKRGKIFTVSRIKIQKKIIQLQRETGIYFTFHTLRHSFATNLLNEGFDITEVQYLLGHENISTTLIYAKVKQKSLERKISEKYNLANIPQK